MNTTTKGEKKSVGLKPDDFASVPAACLSCRSHVTFLYESWPSERKRTSEASNRDVATMIDELSTPGWEQLLGLSSTVSASEQQKLAFEQRAQKAFAQYQYNKRQKAIRQSCPAEDDEEGLRKREEALAQAARC